MSKKFPHPNSFTPKRYIQSTALSINKKAINKIYKCKQFNSYYENTSV